MSNTLVEKYTICQDTICQGFTPVVTGSGSDNPNGTPISFDTEDEANTELESDPEFYKGCFICLISEIGHKTIYHPS